MKLLRTLFFILSITLTTSVNAQDVYKTKTGEKYHTSNCRYLKHSKQKITLQKALDLGYEACKICKPVSKISTTRNSSSLTNTNSSSTTKRATSVQCSGKTKPGNRCKRKTKNANGRCYQH